MTDKTRSVKDHMVKDTRAAINRMIADLRMIEDRWQESQVWKPSELNRAAEAFRLIRIARGRLTRLKAELNSMLPGDERT